MTLNQTIDTVYDLSLGGYFNHEKYSRARFKTQIKNLMQDAEHNVIRNTIVQEIALSDGWWFFTISYLPNCGCYEYWIPDDREGEQQILDKLMDGQK